MAIDITARWPAPPDAVFVLFTDVAFLHDRGIALGAGAEGGKPAIKLDARAEEQRVALES